MSDLILIQLMEKGQKNFTPEDWQTYAEIFLEKRMGLWEATPDECLVGFVNGFTPVYVTPWEKEEGEWWYVWLIFPGEGKAARIVTELLPGTYVDHAGTVIEHPAKWVLVLGTVTCKGGAALLTPEMVREYRERQATLAPARPSQGSPDATQGLAGSAGVG